MVESKILSDRFLLDVDPFAEPEESIFLPEEEIEEKIENEMAQFSAFFNFVSITALLLTGNTTTRGTGSFFVSLALILDPQQVEKFFRPIEKGPFIQVILKRITWILPFGSIVGNAISSIEPLEIFEDIGKGPKPFPNPKPFVDFEKVKNFFPDIPMQPEIISQAKERGIMGRPGMDYFLPLAYYFLMHRLNSVEKRLENEKISPKEKKELRAIQKKLKIYALIPIIQRAAQVPVFVLKRAIELHKQYPHLSVGFFILLLMYLLDRNKEMFILLLSNLSKKSYQIFLRIFGKNILQKSLKQIPLVPDKQVAIPLPDSQKQLMTVLGVLEKQLQIVLFMFEKQVALVADKNKQLALVLDILAKQLELIPDKNKQVAIVLTALAKQLVLRSNPQDFELLTGLEVVVYKHKPLLPQLLLVGNLALRVLNNTPFNGEDYV